MYGRGLNLVWVIAPDLLDLRRCSQILADLPWMLIDVHVFPHMFAGAFYGFSSIFAKFLNFVGFHIFPLIFFGFR